MRNDTIFVCVNNNSEIQKVKAFTTLNKALPDISVFTRTKIQRLLKNSKTNYIKIDQEHFKPSTIKKIKYYYIYKLKINH